MGFYLKGTVKMALNEACPGVGVGVGGIKLGASKEPLWRRLIFSGLLSLFMVSAVVCVVAPQVHPCCHHSNDMLTSRVRAASCGNEAA